MTLFAALNTIGSCEEKRKVIFLPKAKPVDYNTLIEFYNLKLKLLKAA